MIMTFEEMNTAAQNGDAVAQFELGGFYWERSDYTNAILWYAKSAESGNVDAQFSLGAYYHNIERNDNKSFYWHEKAAQQGDG